MSVVRLREIIAECVREVSESHPIDVKQKALETLASLTKVGPLNRDLLAKTDGAIPTLLHLAQSPTSVLQALSLSALFNISLNQDLKQSLAGMETIRNLNAIVLSPASLESGRIACSLICSLAMLDKNKAKFGVAGTIQVLVEAVERPRGPGSHHILSSLVELVQFQGNCSLAVRCGVINVLLRIIEAKDAEDLAGTSLAVLGLLARFDEGLNALVRKKHIVNIMVDVLRGRSMLSKEGAAEILARLFDESEGCISEALRVQDFWSILADLSVRGSPRARDRAVQLMKKVVEANFDVYTDRHNHHMVPGWYC